jgi:hypothetical protein
VKEEEKEVREEIDEFRQSLFLMVNYPESKASGLLAPTIAVIITLK